MPNLSEEGLEWAEVQEYFLFHLYPYYILHFKILHFKIPMNLIKFYDINSISFPVSTVILFPGQQPG